MSISRLALLRHTANRLLATRMLHDSKLPQVTMSQTVETKMIGTKSPRKADSNFSVEATKLNKEWTATQINSDLEYIKDEKTQDGEDLFNDRED